MEVMHPDTLMEAQTTARPHLLLTWKMAITMMLCSNEPDVPTLPTELTIIKRGLRKRCMFFLAPFTALGIISFTRVF